MNTIFDRTSDIKEQWQKDLARVYKETYALLALRIAPLITFPPEAMKELSDPNCPEVFRVAAGLTQNSVQIVSTGILHTYLKVTRPILFDPGKRDITDSTGYSFFLSATPSAAEIYDGLKMICPVAVPLLIEKIEGCPLSAKEQLKNAFQDEQRDVFIDCLNNLDCDISSLSFHSTVLAFERWLYLAMFTNPQAYLDFIYHRHLGSITEIIRATTPSEQELEEALVYINGSYNISFEAQSSSSDGYSPELMDEAMGNAEQMIAAIKNILKTTTRVYKEFEDVLFPFEKDYYTNLLELPYVRPVVEEIEEEQKHEDELSTQTESPKSDDSFTLPKNFFNLVKDNSSCEEHFEINYSVEKGGPKLFLELINYIASQGFIETDYRTKRLFAYVLTGRWKPEDYQAGETITWSDNDHEGKELCYLIKTLIVSDQGKKATKYKKMHRLFIGPCWSKTVPDKDQGNNAPKKFKEALNDLYPDICKL